MRHKSKILKQPMHIKPFHNTRSGVCIDIEMVDIIQKLWGCSVITLGCCQGDRSIILHAGYNAEDIAVIKTIAADDSIIFLQWHNSLDVVA